MTAMAGLASLPLMACAPKKPYTPPTPTALPAEMDPNTRGLAAGVEMVLDAAWQGNPNTIPVFDLKAGQSCHFHVDLDGLPGVVYQLSELDNMWLVRAGDYQIVCDGYQDQCYAGSITPGFKPERYPEENFAHLKSLGYRVCYLPKPEEKGFLESLRRR